MPVHRREQPPSCAGVVDFSAAEAGQGRWAFRARAALRRAPTGANASAVNAADGDTLSLVRFNGTESYAIARAGA
jgi:hypothetical protein